MVSKGAIEVLKVLSVGLGILVFGMGLGAFVARGQAPDWNPAKSLVPGLRCLDGDQDLGTVYQTDDFQIQFHLVNEDKDETFRVTSLHGGCSCTSVTPRELTLAPGGKTTVTAWVDLEAGLAPESLPKEFTEVVIGSAETDLADEVPLTMRAKSVVWASYQVQPQALDFETVVRGELPERAVEIECLSPEPVRSMEVLSASEGVGASFKPLEGKRFRLTARVKPDAPYGPMGGRIRFQAVLASGLFVTRSVPVRGLVVDDLHALPSALLLGVVQLGEWRSAMVTLQSRHGEAFVVESIGAIPEWLTVREQAGAPTSAHRIVLVLKPSSRGSLAATVDFKLRTSAGRRYELQLPVTAYAGPVGPG